MHTARRITCVLLIGLTTAAATAQPAKPIMQHVPSGAMGFAVVNSVSKTAGAAEAMLTDLGVAPMMGINPEEGMGLVDMMRGAAMLGEGFNPDGGFAFVMLDPQQFDVDLLAMMEGPPAGEEPPKLPFVVFVPGSGVQGVFGNYETKPEGDYTLIQLRMGPMYAAERPGYVLLSPRTDALDAIGSQAKPVSATLDKAHQGLLAGSDVGISLNMRIVGPLYSRLLEKFAEAPYGPAPAAPNALMKMYMDIYSEMLSQTEDVTIGLSMPEDGLVFQEMVSFRPDSEFGKIMSGLKLREAKIDLSRVPDMPYVLAMGTVNNDPTPAERKIAERWMDQVFALEAMAAVPDETLEKLKQLSLDLDEQLVACEFVGGGAPAGSGVFALSAVMTVKDAGKTMDILVEGASTTEAMIKALVDDDDVQQLSIVHAAGVATVDGVSVDEIAVKHPELESGLSETDREEMTMVLGEDKLRLLIAKVDKETLVLTFGGSEAYLGKAIATATNGGGVGIDPATAARAMPFMPEKRTGLILLNVGNLFDVIQTGMTRIEGEDAMLPMRVASKAPIIGGMGLSGPSLHVSYYVPNELMREIVRMAMMGMMVRKGGGPAQPADQPQQSESRGETHPE